MPSREEIREQIAKIVANNPKPKEVDYETADIVLAYLHSKDVALIDRDRELPLVSEADVEEWSEAVKSGIIVYQRFMVKEGYEATIPLVKV